MIPKEAPSVKLIMGLLFSDEDYLEKALDILEQKYGRIDIQSTRFHFDITDYYEEEMGGPIFRLFITFDRLIQPDDIAEIKVETNEIESQMIKDQGRKVNLDPGYMDYDKIVLASAKYNGQKIYLNQGIWADLTLYYKDNAYHPYPWSFPDFKNGLYDDFFLKVRARYKGQRRRQERKRKE